MGAFFFQEHIHIKGLMFSTEDSHFKKCQQEWTIMTFLGSRIKKKGISLFALSSFYMLEHCWVDIYWARQGLT